MTVDTEFLFSVFLLQKCRTTALTALVSGEATLHDDIISLSYDILSLTNGNARNGARSITRSLVEGKSCAHRRQPSPHLSPSTHENKKLKAR